MGTIPLADADGRAPLPICRRHREWLTAYYKSEEAIVLRFFTWDVKTQPVEAIDMLQPFHTAELNRPA